MSESLKLRLERVNQLARLRLENLQRFYDLLPVSERYCEGHIELHVHLISRVLGWSRKGGGSPAVTIEATSLALLQEGRRSA